MKKTIGLIIFIALVGILACNKDTDDVKSDIFTQASAEEWFNSTFKKSEEWQQNADSENKVPDWSNGTYLKKDSIEVFEFPLIENKATISVPADKTITSNETKKILDATLSRMVIIKTSTNEMIVRKLYYVPEYKYLLSKGYDISNVMFNKTNDDFTGLLITKKWNDEVLSYHQLENGKIEQMLVKYDVNTPQSNSLNNVRINNYASAKTSGLGDEQNLDDVVINNNYHAPVTYVYLPSQPYYSTTSPSYNPYGTGGGGSDASTGVTPISIAISIEDNIDETNLDPCPKAVLATLKTAKNADIAKLLAQLGATKKYNYIIKSGYAGGVPAQSDSSIPFNYTTTISQDYTSATALFRANNILHEIVHVYFMSIVDEFKAKGYPTGGYNLSNFPSLFQAYCDKRFPPSETTSANAHHLEMANQYVYSIATALQEYNTGIAVPDGGIPSQVYTDLAWGGLRDAPVFYAKFTRGGADDMRIKNRYASESVGNVIGQGTPNEQKPVGKPCN